MNHISTHIRSNVVGYVGVFLALTGSAVALPGRATVQSNDLKPNAVKAKHIKDGQVASAEVAPDSLTGADINEETLAVEGGGTPSGPAGGDLAGTYPNPQLRSDAVGSPELQEGSVKTSEVLNGQIQAEDLGDNQITGDKVSDFSLTGADIASFSLTEDQLAPDSVTGTRIDESSLSCAKSTVAVSGRVTGGAAIPATYTSDPTFIDGASTCGQTPQVRRVDVGVYRICVAVNGGQAPEAVVATPIQSGPDSPGADNIVSIGQVGDSGCLNPLPNEVHEIRILDVGTTVTPQDGDFRFMAVDF